MNFKWSTVAAISIAPSFFVVNAVLAAPYQIEATGFFSQGKVEASNGAEEDFDIIDFELTYYLQQVDTPSGPLAERAFLDKAAYVSGSINQIKPEFSGDTDSMGLDARFVTDTDLIFELGYETSDDGSANDETTIALGLGKYLDGQTTAILNYEKEDDVFDETTLTGTYRKLNSSESVSTAFSTEFSLSYIDTEQDSGYGLGGGIDYYLSDTTSVSVFVDYEEIDDVDTTTFGLGGEYFFADNLFASGLYSLAENDAREISGIALRLGARF